jgi:C-terminal processing protease CtpA/Prc
VNLQPITQRWCAIFTFLLVVVFTVFPASMSAQAQPSTQSLDGLWLTDGYGELIEFKGDELRSFEITKQSCIPVGKANSAAGYLRIHSFSRYSEDKEFARQLVALENALDAIFKDAAKWTGLVIDVRINGGGSDVFGISIASRLATQEYLAYSKVIRNDIHDSDHRTPPQPVIVHISQRPGFRGPVVLLTSADSVSAAETFTMAVLDRQPHVIRVGENTQGVFSDVLGRKLPNGWSFGLPNEIYLTKDGRAFDGMGVPPDVEVPIFPTEDLANGRDSALNKAVELLASKDK